MDDPDRDDRTDKARAIWADLGVAGVASWRRVSRNPAAFVLTTTDAGEVRLSEYVFATYSAIQKKLTVRGHMIKGVKNQSEWMNVCLALVRVADDE